MMSKRISEPMNFYPRPPRGGRRECIVDIDSTTEFLSTPSARRATSPCVAWEQGHSISIHALREEGDASRCLRVHDKVISIHALREEGDSLPLVCRLTTSAFLSTPSARRATPAVPATRSASSYFYPRPPRGGRPRRCKHSKRSARFLSTPSARRATLVVNFCVFGFAFLSTPSARRATNDDGKIDDILKISIHALREEGDRREK